MMKKLGIVVGVAVVLILSLTVATATMAQVQTICYVSGFDYVVEGSYIISTIYDPVTLQVYFQRTVPGSPDFRNALLPVRVPITAIEDIDVYSNDGTYLGTSQYVVSDPQWHMPDSDCDGGRIGDGRINDGPRELGAPLAAFCSSSGIAVWDIDTEGHGTLGFTSTAAEIDAGLAAAASSGFPTLIGSGLGNSLYATPHGQLAVVGPDLRDTGKVYQFNFAGNRCG